MARPTRPKFQAALGILVSICAGAPAPAQKPGEARLAAVFAGGGSVAWDELYLELARRHRGKPFGKEALDHLIDKQVVEREAARRDTEVPEAEVDRWIETLRTQLRSQNLALEQHLKSRAMTLSEFRDYVRLSRLYERLARADLGLGETEALDPGRRELWMREKRRIHGVKTAIQDLPENVAAVVDGASITLRDLGRMMARNLVADERESILRQMVAYRLLQREAAKLDVEITEQDYEEAFAVKRREFETDPEYKQLGLTLEGMLQAQGRTIQDLRNGEVFRAEVLILRLGRMRFPDAQLAASYEQDVRLWQGRVGASRDLHRLLLRAGPQRSAEEAKKLCERLRTQIRSPSDFAAAARRFSEDEKTKRRGGSLGYVHRQQPGIDDALLRAAFQLRVGEVSEPVEDQDGWSLLLVTGSRPAPEGAELRAKMRQWEMSAWLRALVEDAQLEYRPLPTSS